MNARTTLPEYGNPFYNTKSVGGYSYCIVGEPTCDGRNVLANCVGYACGRFNEIIGSMKYPYLNCNAQNFIYRAREEYPDLQITDYPTLGGIMVFKKIGANYGHVFIVEKLVDSNTIYTSESAWHGKAFFNATRYKSSNWSMSGYEFLGNIVNPTIGDVHWVDPQPPKPVDDLKVGDSVEIIGTGKATIYGEDPTSYGIGWHCHIGKIYEGYPYPYRVDDSEGAIGFYQKDALKKI